MKEQLPATLRRALDFCETHAAEPISTEDIAQAAHTGVRTLQRAFRTHLEMTPLRHLHRIRLNRAHQDLVRIAEGRARGTVSDVAMRWGFTHLGRFAAQYRQTFGHTPVQTLNRPARSPHARTACAAQPPGAGA